MDNKIAMKMIKAIMVASMLLASVCLAQQKKNTTQQKSVPQQKSTAQQKNTVKENSSAENWISGEISFFGIGARYERMLTNEISIGANAYWNSFFFLWNEAEIGGSFRYYVLPIFFVGAGLGFHIHTGTMEYEYKEDPICYYGYCLGESKTYTGTWWGSISGLAITPEAGWRIDVGDSGGFFLQPGLKIPITLGMKETYLSLEDEEFGVGFGIVPYLGMGYAF
jgi:hypothetical protein